MRSEAIFLIKKGSADKAFERRPNTLRQITDGEVIIEVEAFGLNYADVMARRGLYREAPPFPCVVGYEVVGTIIETGSKVDDGLKGKRVVAFCRFGGYARHIITWDYAVVPIGETPAEEAMVLCTQAVTAYYMAEYLTPVRKGEKVLIHAAAGGVGTVLIQLAKRKGAEVFAKIGNDDKMQLVRSLGADHVINYNRGDYAEQILQITKGDRLDVSFNPVAGSTFKKDFSLLGSGGRIILFGGSEMVSGKWGLISTLNFLRKMGLILPVGLMMRSKNILGVNMLKIADNRPMVLAECLKAVVELHAAGELKPQVGGVYPADKIAEAHAALESGSTTGKLTVFWEK
ncbi:MAG: zinc-binding alcohol dehydrogenase family protein [Flavobacteriia bacterium]|jgi:NADPH:quinone reductase-like Zn-dependent oxidoreductase